MNPHGSVTGRRKSLAVSPQRLFAITEVLFFYSPSQTQQCFRAACSGPLRVREKILQLWERAFLGGDALAILGFGESKEPVSQPGVVLAQTHPAVRFIPPPSL